MSVGVKNLAGLRWWEGMGGKQLIRIDGRGVDCREGIAYIGVTFSAHFVT